MVIDMAPTYIHVCIYIYTHLLPSISALQTYLLSRSVFCLGTRYTSILEWFGMGFDEQFCITSASPEVVSVEGHESRGAPLAAQLLCRTSVKMTKCAWGWQPKNQWIPTRILSILYYDSFVSMYL